MEMLQADIVGRDDGQFPPVVVCEFVDAHGKTWQIREKEPVVRRGGMPPTRAFIAGEIICRANGIICFDTRKPWGLEALDGTTVFHVRETLLAPTDAQTPP